MNEDILINKKIPTNAQKILEEFTASDIKIYFAIVGDLNINGKYATTTAFFSKDSLYIYDGDENSTTYETYKYSELSEVVSKRMYGNATLSAKMPDGKRKILFRYTYSVAPIGDASALFINHINDGQDFNNEYAIIAVSYENALSVCPKCGRHLLHPGAECIMCKSKLRVLNKFAKYITPQIRRIIICIILSLFTTFMALVPPSITGYIVDNVFPTGSGDSGFAILDTISNMFGNGDTGTILIVMILLLLLTYILNYTVGTFRSYLMNKVGVSAVTDLRNDIYDKAQYLPMTFYDKSSTGSVINRISSDANTLQAFMQRITQEAVVYFFQMIGIVIIMVSINPVLTLLSLLPIPIIVLTARVFSKKVKPFYERIWRLWSRVTSNLTDTLPCIKVIKSFSGEENTSTRFQNTNNNFASTSLKLSKITMTFPQIISFLITCGSLIIWGFGGQKVISGTPGYTAGLIVTFISYASMFYTPVTFFANLSDSFQSCLASAERVLDILDAEPETHEESHVIPGGFNGEIEFLHVGFSFDRTKKVLDDVSFKIKPGEVVGIVGTTGAGKSTLVNLLLRFYSNYSGEILVDGHNIKNFDLHAYREQIGYVQQEPMMFSDTIYNNILFGRPNATPDEVIKAADIANAHTFIAKQPEGYDTVLGERGVGVSGGEKQRLSIARAVLKQPSILIFDEATAAVDSETEKLIQNAIDKLIEGKTTIMIAHRLSTLKKANRIIVVDNGKIIENGTPEELLALKGKYYKLIQIQSMNAEAEKIKQEERIDI